ncbi:hypothetical protein Skr01_56610 [Sphaerisporangium krabiense]|uniref:DUF5709 domain-containing protein n=1 Tax=Sphaerisporangium krabiense TaxID=763782 RepID=A0A7W9DTM1_9ACTN|nr:DUF5709 domain-containing protein [Sphaerisporangium krabiense]MBB5630743.1 hypothetical protein [Sphaerisporangium krabiense]GII65576.1 hypothetical protein Skr01_56610 [Sphaerisporangium krabiense]
MSETRREPDMGDDEQLTEIEEWTDNLPIGYEITPDDPRQRDDLDRRLWREAPDRARSPREEHRLVAPDEGARPDRESEEYAEDLGADDGDLSAEERAIHIEPD